MTVPVWLSKWPLTQSWEGHRKNGSLGGEDYGTPVGTRILSPSAGTVTYYTYKDGSSCARVQRADGSATEFLHGRAVGKSGRRVKEGEVVATSDGRKGTPGAGPSTGPHIHVHDVTAAGVRVRPFSTVPETVPEEDAMAAKVHKRGEEYFASGPGVKPTSTTSKARGEGLARALLPNGVADIIDTDMSWTAWSELKAAAISASPTVGSVSGVDYAALAKAIFDEQARRIAT